MRLCGRLALVGLVASGCSRQPAAAPAETTGHVHQSGRPVAGALVQFAALAPIVTDAQGGFALPALDPGVYAVVVSSQAAQGFVQKSLPVAIGAGVGLDVELPEPVELLPQVAATSGSITVAWTRASSPSFREYKLYVGDDASATDVDDTTGRLLFTSVDRDATSFVHGGELTLGPGATRYYRVYTLDDQGGLAGSNVLEAHTSTWDGPPPDLKYVCSSHSSIPVCGGLTGERIGGVTWDGSAYWVAIVRELGNYHDPDEIVVRRIDASSHQPLETFTYTDEAASPGGLIWDGTALWLDLRADSRRLLRRLDPAGGDVTRQFARGDDFVTGIAWDGSSLVLVRSWTFLDSFRAIERVDAETGAQVHMDRVVSSVPSEGAAWHDGHLWIQDGTRALLFDADNLPVGEARGSDHGRLFGSDGMHLLYGGSCGFTRVACTPVEVFP